MELFEKSVMNIAPDVGGGGGGKVELEEPLQPVAIDASAPVKKIAGNNRSG
jgi:hypothetical protein